MDVLRMQRDSAFDAVMFLTPQDIYCPARVAQRTRAEVGEASSRLLALAWRARDAVELQRRDPFVAAALWALAPAHISQVRRM